eukprot:2890061-Pyramimonas_sp.AAC.1
MAARLATSLFLATSAGCCRESTGARIAIYTLLCRARPPRGPDGQGGLAHRLGSLDHEGLGSAELLLLTFSYLASSRPVDWPQSKVSR